MDSSSWPSMEQISVLKKNLVSMADVAEDDINVVASPYRVCPLGAHIDHQGGPVTAFAVNRGVLLAFAPVSKSKTIWLRSLQFSGNVRFDLDSVPERKLPSILPFSEKSEGEDAAGGDIVARRENSAANGGGLTEEGKREDGSKLEEGMWGDYARGAVLALQQKGFLLTKGIAGIVDGSRGLQGGGISSSAAFGVAILLALEHANGLQVSPEENIELDRLIENGYLGLKNGILDQSAILLSQRGHLALIRCQDKTHERVAPPWLTSGEEKHVEDEPFRILLAFSGLAHALASKPGYNLRVQECHDAAATLLSATSRHMDPLSGPPLLGLLSPNDFDSHGHLLTPDQLKRARHFFEESARVSAGISAWASGDLEGFGQLISQSGESSIVNYECGCDPMVDLRSILLKAPGVLGSRFSGAGFRGCCIALVRTQDAHAAAAYVRNAYAVAQPDLAKLLDPDAAVLVCRTADGARVL